jgi:signal transduction histidine kinase
MHTRARVSRHSDGGDTVGRYSGGHGIDEPIKGVQVALEHAAQLSTLAELSASIAHEISQPLSAIVANGAACTGWLSAKQPNIERARQAMERIMRDAQGVSEIVQQIRALYHHGSMSCSPLDLNLLVRETEEFLRAECLHRHATLALALAPMPPIQCDRVQIQQVLTNLVRNALDALAVSSDPIRVITVTTDSADAAHVRLMVDDTGPGFSDHRRAFEAFYTTKNSGMGMGLAICRRIVKSHGGEIRARNLQPRGARVELFLPAAPERLGVQVTPRTP